MGLRMKITCSKIKEVIMINVIKFSDGIIAECSKISSQI